MRGLGLVIGIILVIAGGVLLVYDPGGIIITWSTASEVDTMGFNLYRAEGSAEGTFELVNTEPIPATGDPLTGAEYQLEDRDVEPGHLYFYLIEEIEWNGTRQRYPELVQTRAGLSRFWLVVEGAVLLLLGCGLVYRQLRQLRAPRDQTTMEHSAQDTAHG
jgi:hypothetical protein